MLSYTWGVRPLLLALIATLAGTCAAGEPADTLLVGGLVHTSAGVRRLTVAVGGGRVLALVPPGEEAAWRGPESRVVELGGGHILPGLIDAHLHLVGYGKALEQVDLRGAASWAEVVERASAAAAGLPDGSWLEGRGWDQNLWPGAAMPDRALLDEALPDRPVLLRRVDGHAAVANGAALAAAGIDGHTPDPPGGRIGRRADGDPSGLLVDDAVDLVIDRIPVPTAADIERRALLAADTLAAMGFTQVEDAGTTAAELAVLRRLEAEQRLPLRVYVLLDGSDDDLLDRELPRGPVLTPGGLVRVGGVKLYADGALGSRGALLGADYADDPGNRGLAVTPLGRLAAVIRRASAAGFQVGVHAIGDEAVHRVLDLYTGVGAAVCRRLHHRIEHSQTVRPEDVARFAELGVVASVQPTHCTSDMPWAPQRLGPERIAWAYRWRSLADAGVVLAGGSDAPVEDPDPRRGLYAAVTRQREDGTPAGGWSPTERLTLDEALALFTEGAAYAARAEGWCGAIRPGFAADLTVLDGDPTSVAPERILHLRVLRTMVGGVDGYVAATAGGGA